MSKKLDRLYKELERAKKIAHRDTIKEKREREYIEHYGAPDPISSLMYDQNRYDDPYIVAQNALNEYVKGEKFIPFDRTTEFLKAIMHDSESNETSLGEAWMNLPFPLNIIFMPVNVALATAIATVGLTFIAPPEIAKATVHSIKNARDRRIEKARKRVSQLEREICEEIQKEAKQNKSAEDELADAPKAKVAKSPVLTQSKEDKKEETENK